MKSKKFTILGTDTFLRSVILAMTAIVALISACKKSPEGTVPQPPPERSVREKRSVGELFRPSPDKDLTAVAGYNFSPFAGTVWKTRTKTAIMESKRYTGAWDTKLYIPERFDPAHPRYNPPVEARIIAVLPPGTRLRISRLLHDL
jgi:hypothetical protein